MIVLTKTSIIVKKTDLKISPSKSSEVILTKIDEILRMIKISKRLAEEYAKIEFLIEKILFKKKLLRKNKKFLNIFLKKFS